MTNTEKAKIKEIMAKGEYNYYGLRYDDREFEIGEEVPCSYIWEDGDPTDEELPGTCAVTLMDDNDLDRIFYWIDRRGGYPCEHVYLIGSNSLIDVDEIARDVDLGECLMRQPEVLAEL